MGTVCHASGNSIHELKTPNITDKIGTVRFANGPVRLGARQGVCTKIVWSDLDLHSLMGKPINSERSVAVSFSKLFSPLFLRHLMACKVTCPRTEDVIIDSQPRVANGRYRHSQAGRRTNTELARLFG
jgi:hypothetical protein